MKILILESDEQLRQSIALYFKKEGYICEQAANLREGFRKLNNYDYDCAIIDPGLPGTDGLELIRFIREEAEDTGILITSELDDVQQRIRCLNAGADDFLLKPYHQDELNARLKAVLRRTTKQFNRELVFGPLSINLDERSARVNQESLPLTRKEFDILVYLARNRNRVVAKESLAEHLWGDYMDSADSFDFIYAHVKNLRRKLAAKDLGKMVHTVYGTGYQFIEP